MTRLPPPPSLAELLDRGKVAILLDFDGTLVEIADRPDDIAVRPDMGELLERLATRLQDRVAVISGRSLADLETHVGIPAVACAGSHGAERRSMTGEAMGAPETLNDEAIAALRHIAAEQEGVLLEEKTFGIAFHYREQPEAGPAIDGAARAVANAHGLKVKTGKFVVEVTAGQSCKDAAVRLFMGKPRFTGALPVFIGDDVTDEDGFGAAERLGGFGVLVGDRTPTAARYQLADPAAVHEWLGW